MLERERTLFEFARGYADKLLADLSDDQLTVQPSPAMNTPLWIIGHLTICVDFGLGLLGQPKVISPRWHVSFGPGTKPGEHRIPTPTRAALLAEYDRGHAALAKATELVMAEQLVAPNPSGIFTAELPTVGDILAHLMSTHEAMHLGQLSAWRRLMGLPGVLGV